MKHQVIAVCSVGIVAAFAFAARGEDWNQWRGPDRNGIAKACPPLATNWPKEGPVKVWESEKMPSGGDGGFGSVTVAGGKAYVFVNWKTHPATPVRRLGDGQIRQLGWFPEKMPDELAKAMEEGRVSPERQALKPEQLKPWLDAWVTNHIADEAVRKQLSGIVQGRLTKGTNAIPLEVLAKLATIKDKDFPDQAALDRWYGENDIPEAIRKEAAKVIPTTREVANDAIVCLNAVDGKTVWKKELPGQPFGWGSSSTPCVSSDRVYAVGGKCLYCLSASDGALLWQAALKGGEVSSSPVVADGVVAVLGGQLMAFDASDGKELWSQPKVTGNNPSPVVWSAGGKAYLVCNSAQGLAATEVRGTNVLWTVPGGGSGTPVVNGDTVVLLSDNKQVGLVAYRISPEKAEKLWSKEWTDRGTTLILYEGNVYGIGANKAFCVGLADGTVKWEQNHGCEIASPILADGKVLGTVGSGGTLLMMRAAPEKYDLLAKASMRIAGCSSPAIADGKLYVRLNDAVGCYDLTKAAPAP